MSEIKESVQQESLGERAARAKEIAELLKHQQPKKESSNKGQSIER